MSASIAQDMQTVKFGRSYELIVQPNAEVAAVSGNPNADALAFVPPLTLEFDITRNIQQKSNEAQLRIWNLSERHRNQIRFQTLL